MNITRGKITGAQKVIIFGPEGIGKSTFASQFPDPLFVDTEGSTKHLDVARMPAPTSWQAGLRLTAKTVDGGFRTTSTLQLTCPNTPPSR